MTLLLIMYSKFDLPKVDTVQREFLAEENLGEFGESLVVHQTLPSKLRQCLVKKANKQEFPKGLLAKISHYMTLKRVRNRTHNNRLPVAVYYYELCLCMNMNGCTSLFTIWSICILYSYRLHGRSLYNMVSLHPIFIQVAWAFIVPLKPPNHSQQLRDHIQIYTAVGVCPFIMNPCYYTHISWQQKIMCCSVNDIQW